MFGLQFAADHKSWLFAAVFFPGLALAQANDAWLSGKDNFLNLDLDQMENMGLLPVGLLDDDSLQKLADAHRSGSTQQNNLINIYWLMGNRLDEGKFREHFRRNLTRVFLQYLENRFQNTQQNNSANRSQLNKQRLTEDDYAHRYRVKVRNDQLSLNYVIPF